MINVKEEFLELFDFYPSVFLLLKVAFNIQEQAGVNGLFLNECYMKAEDVTELSAAQYISAIEKLVGRKIIKVSIDSNGTRIKLLDKNYIVITDEAEHKRKKREVKIDVVHNNNVEQKNEIIAEQESKEVLHPAENKEESVNTGEFPASDIEKSMLIGSGQFEENVCKPEYVMKGIPSHLLCKLTPIDKAQYFESVKEETLNAHEYLNKLAFEVSQEIAILKEELVNYFDTSLIKSSNLYNGGIKSAKAIFKNHARKKYLQKEVTEKKQTLFKRFVSAYFRFHTEILKNPQPKFASREGKSINILIDYFVKASNGDEERAVQAVNAMYDKWNELPDYYRKFVDINTIAYKITEIINYFKNGQPTHNIIKTKSEQRRDTLKNWGEPDFDRK